ncbi:MAG: hypothetical protein LBV08_03875 [Clostridiales bacterium]|jgi:hypothetical protein|nr:hypothetical protein [Clostridiales bacterium]
MDKKYPNPDITDTQNVASSTECTGLMNTIDDGSEVDSLQDIYKVPDQKSK